MAADARDTPTQNRLDVALLLRDLGYIKDRIDQICQSDKKQDERLDHVERITWAVCAVTGLTALVFVPVAASALKMWLGLP